MRTSWLIAFGGCFLFLAGAAFTADTEDNDDEQEQTIALGKLPRTVTDAVKARFPNGELKAAEMGKDDGVTVYEVELKDAGTSIDVCCKTDGTILKIEKEIAVADLPAAVTQAINAKYPNAKINEAEEVTELEEADDEEADNDDQDGDDEEEDDELVYEVEITTADDKNLEVEVTPAGKILEVEADDDEPGEADEE